MKLQAYSYSNQGGQDHNEDCVDFALRENGGVFVLADGLGGHQNGEEASALVTRMLLDALSGMSQPDPAAMDDAFRAAGAALLAAQAGGDMKTTAVALQIQEDQALWGHVGDSRLYHFSDGEIVSMTRDHSVTYKKYLGGDISYAQIRGDEDRTSLLGVLGNAKKCEPEILSAPCPLQEGDAFLLCSDGFWEYVWEEEMCIDLIKSETPERWAEYMLLRHIRRARPSYDNLSLIAVFVGEEDLACG